MQEKLRTMQDKKSKRVSVMFHYVVDHSTDEGVLIDFSLPSPKFKHGDLLRVTVERIERKENRRG